MSGSCYNGCSLLSWYCVKRYGISKLNLCDLVLLEKICYFKPSKYCNKSINDDFQ